MKRYLIFSNACDFKRKPLSEYIDPYYTKIKFKSQKRDF